MSDSEHTPAAAPNPQPPSGRTRKAAWIAVAVIAVGLTGAAATSAFSRGPGFGPMHWHGGGSCAAR